MKIEIRRARPGEEFTVSRLLAEVWHATHDAALGPDKVAEITARWHAPTLLRAQIEDSARNFLVAVAENGVVAGHALSWLEPDSVVTLLRLYVVPEQQGRGLGKGLLEESLAAYPSGRLLRLEVQAANAPAIRFYEKQGLRITGDTSGRGGLTDVPALIMERPLPFENLSG